jgi:hypothetical protein
MLLALMTYWVAHATGWWRLRWPAAAAADAAIVWLLVHNIPAEDPFHVTAAIAASLGLFVGSLGSFAIRTLLLRRDVIRFEVFQSGAALILGYGGAAYVARVSSLETVPFGLAGLMLGVGAYAVSFWRDATHLSRSNFYYFSTLAIALTIAGGSLALPVSWAASLWIIVAPACAWLGRRYSHATLTAHGSAYLIAASAASGLLALTGYALLGPVPVAWREVTPIALAVLVAAAVCSAITPLGVRTLRAANVVMSIAGRRPYLGVPRAIALAVFVLGLSGVAIAEAVVFPSGQPGIEGDWGIVATVRTIALALSAALMGLLARGDRVREAGWLVYPLLIATGMKILLEDFRHSEPSRLFVALIVYGGALIVAPRLASKR